jgi:heme b synthase
LNQAHFHPGHPTSGQRAGDRPVPRLVFWETTAGCNLNCIHCRRLDVADQLMKSDMTTDQGKQLLDQVAVFSPVVFVFSGGEPLMRPDIFELGRHARSIGLITALATNGTLIDGEMAENIRDAGFHRVSISLDGADADTHDRFRQLPGSFNRAVDGLTLLNRAGVSTQVNCTIARHNADQLPKMITLAEKVAADAVHYFLLVPVGCGQEIADGQMLSGPEVEERLKLLADLSTKTDLHLKATCAPHYYRIIRQEAAQAGRRISKGETGHPMTAMTKGCLAATAVCFVSHEGDVFPCGYLPVKAGNVRQTPFQEIWESSEVFAALRDPDLLTGKCGCCEFKRVCGGCRARAFYEHGDYLAEEPFCVYEPARTRDPESTNPR